MLILNNWSKEWSSIERQEQAIFEQIVKYIDFVKKMLIATFSKRITK